MEAREAEERERNTQREVHNWCYMLLFHTNSPSLPLLHNTPCYPTDPESISESSNPLSAAVVAAPILKLCP